MQARPILATLIVFAGLCVPGRCVLGVGDSVARAIGDGTDIELRTVEYAGADASLHPTAMKRLAWEVRQRTSVSTKLEPTRMRLSDPRVFESPFLYWTGANAFPALSPAELSGLRRFVEFGGFLWIDDAAPDAPSGEAQDVRPSGFDASVRRELGRAFGTSALIKLPGTHVIYRSFYLVQHPTGRAASGDFLEAIERAGRVAVVYSRHDIGGALERDNVGHYDFAMPASDREMAFRTAVNFVLYALCLDYKDDQVHAPFILRRWAGRP